MLTPFRHYKIFEILNRHKYSLFVVILIFSDFVNEEERGFFLLVCNIFCLIPLAFLPQIVNSLNRIQIILLHITYSALFIFSVFVCSMFHGLSM